MSEQGPSKGAVVVTGTSTGIGEACALHLDRLGFRVFAGVRNTADGQGLKAKASGRLIPIQLDITDAATIASALDRVATALDQGGLAGLVNNAGIAVAGPLEFLPIGEIRKQLEVNVLGQIAVTQAFLSLLRKGRGRVVNIGSISGRSALPFLGPYAASKFAMEALTDSLRLELRPWNIRVSIVEPGTIATPIWRKSLAAADEIARDLPERARQLYGPAIASMRRISAARTPIPAQAVAEAVEHALTAKRPRTRYVVGRDARLRKMLELLPDRTRDWLISRRLRAGQSGGQGRQ
jgi:NAD(P)-dependent dehydrogenase (short-subunit alcohol dehydrogenase family)